MTRRTVAIALLTLAAGLGAVSFIFAHLDYRDREEYYVRLESARLRATEPDLEPPTRESLYAAFGFGVPAVILGAISIGIGIFELRVFQNRGTHG